MKFTKILFVIIVATMFFSGNKITKATSGHCTNWSEVNDLVAEVQFHNSCGYDDFAVSVNGVNLENTSGTTVTAGQSSILVGADLCNTCNSAASGIGAFITTVTFNGSTQQLTNYSGSGSGYGTYWLNMPTTPGSYNIVFKNWMSGSPSYVGTTTIPVTIVAAPINGACSPSHYNCSTGTSTNNVAGASSWTWTCAGLNGGTNAPCSEIKPVSTVNVSSNISSASWTITGPATLTGTGISKSYTSQPAGTYTITWNDVAGYKNPGTDNQSLIAGGTINFSGNYMACVYTCGSTLPSCPTTVGSLYCLDSCTGGYTLQSNCTSCPTPTTITCSALTPGTWKEVAP